MPGRKSEIWDRVKLAPDQQQILERAPKVIIPASRAELFDLAVGGRESNCLEVAYEVPGKGRVIEAMVVRCKNGAAVNYLDPYMRRRDPDCMVIADDRPSDKLHFSERFTQPFPALRQAIFDWLSQQELIVLPFAAAGDLRLGYDSLLIAPLNAAFFAAGLADLQGMIPGAEVPEGYNPQAIIYLAPPFRHTHCDGRQIVIHNRSQELHELFSLNLYPGPSAKKGIYGVLLSIGEKEGWLTAHGSTVQVVTPYDNILTIMHEGASGGGKSEMLEHAHRQLDGRLLLGTNVVTGDKRYLVLPRGCELQPVTDDMALCHPDIQNDSRRLVVTDAEGAWFLRVNHISRYGIDPHYESLTTHPPEPIIFLNMHAVAGATCLIWEHIEDAPGQPCPNPRVILPRRMVPGIIDQPVEVDIRSFGLRMPPCTAAMPTYGIAGFLHFLPPALGWLWRLVSPRGYDNPSIVGTEAMSSEGVGSYWPFATGRRVDQANLLLEQIRSTPGTRYTLTPNQHVGAWHTGFMPQWISREYLARRGGAKFRPGQIGPARCPLLGYVMTSMMIEGTLLSEWFLRVETQPEVGPEGYDAGARILADFFHRELRPYLDEHDLDPQGRRIIECCLSNGTLEEYEALLAPAT